MVDNGNHFQIGLDPWPGSHMNHIMLRELWEALANRNYDFLSQVGDDGRNSIWGQGWMLGVQLHLDAHLCGEWEGYVNNLRKSHIRLSEDEDSLIWEKSSDG